MGRETVSDEKRLLPPWLAALFVVSWFAIILAVGLGLEGMQRAHQEHIERDAWPPVTAKVETCYVDRFYPFQSDGGGVNYGVRCWFVYAVNDVVYRSKIEFPGQHHSLPGSGPLPADVVKLENWATRHRKGSSQDLHYDPANPATVSLAGAADDLRTNTAAIALFSAEQAGIAGAALLALAMVARRLRR